MYFLFAGSDYYPSGGMRDYQGTFATLEEAQQLGQAHDELMGNYSRFNWSHVAQVINGKLQIIWEWGEGKTAI